MAATSVPVTPGSGAPIAVDQIGGVDYQRVKLVDGTLDSTTVGEVSAPADSVSRAGLWANAQGYVYDAGSGLFLRQRGDASGRAMAVGAAAAGSAVAGNPVLVGGTDGTNARAVRVDGNGMVAIGGGNAANNAADSGNPIKVGSRVAGLDPAMVLVGTLGNRQDVLSDGMGRLQVVAPPAWAINHQPAANTQATASKAAVAGVRHVLTALYACVWNSAAATATVLVVQVRDGASGAGAVLWSVRLAVAAATLTVVDLFQTGLALIGTANTALTVEFSAAGGANTNEIVCAAGFSTV